MNPTLLLLLICILNRNTKLICMTAALIGLAIEHDKTPRSCQVSYINKSRPNQGAGNNLYKEIIENNDKREFFELTRMSFQQFHTLLCMVGPRLQRNFTRPDIVDPETILLLTLRYLATGDSFHSLHLLFRLGKETVRACIHETTRVIWDVLKLPALTENTFIQTAKSFEVKSNFPNVAGALDGKHIMIRAPPKSGSKYICFKKFFSIVLLAICDANYRFTYVHVGTCGSMPDAGIFRQSNLGRALESGAMRLPPPTPTRNSSQLWPYVLLGDSAFALKPYMMIPYNLNTHCDNSKIIYNNEQSSARIFIENSFGILTARWAIFSKRLSLFPENAKFVCLACVALHNFLLSSAEHRQYVPAQLVDRVGADGRVIPGDWRSHFTVLQSGGTENTNRTNENAKELRDRIKDYLYQRRN